jgi:hypothetical protein
MFADKKAAIALMVALMILVSSLTVSAQGDDPIILEPTSETETVPDPEPIEFEDSFHQESVSEAMLAGAEAMIPPSWWNMLKNSSVEDGNLTPDYWTSYSWAGSAQFIWQKNLSVTGARSLKIVQVSPDDGRWQQNVTVEPNTDYVLSGWIKTLKVAHTVETIDAGANLSVDTYLPVTGWYTKTPPLIGTNDWTFVSVVFNSGDNNQLLISARLGIYWGTTTGTAWFDNIQLAPVKKIYISSSQNGTVGGVPFTSSDILVHDPVRNTWAMYFDGSDVGIARNVDCLEVLWNGDIMLSLEQAQSVSGLGKVQPQDIILFSATSTGTNTAGTFSMHLRGKDAGLDTIQENIDACSFGGFDIISTSGPTDIVANGADDDLFSNNTGPWSIFLLGNSVPNLKDEDIRGFSMDVANSGIKYLSTQDTYYPGDGRGITNRQIFAVDGKKVLRPLFWSGPEHGFRYAIDGFSIETPLPMVCYARWQKSDGGMVGYWSFDNNRNLGSDALGVQNGTAYGDPVWLANGQAGGALDLDGVNDYINLGTAKTISDWPAYTMSIWFRHMNRGQIGVRGYGQKIISKADFYRDMHLQIVTNDSSGRLQFWTTEPGRSLIDERNFIDQTWHHAIVTKQGNKGQLWVDGVLVKSGLLSSPMTADVPLILGYTAHTDHYQQRFFGGSLDEFALFDRALNEAEIGVLYQRGLFGQDACPMP